MNPKDTKKNILLILNSMMETVIETPEDEIERFNWQFDTPVITIPTGSCRPPAMRYTGEKIYKMELNIRRKNHE